jgi:hypothetical protein
MFVSAPTEHSFCGSGGHVVAFLGKTQCSQAVGLAGNSVFGLYLGCALKSQDADYCDQGFSWFSSLPPCKFQDSTQIR